MSRVLDPEGNLLAESFSAARMQELIQWPQPGEKLAGTDARPLPSAPRLDAKRKGAPQPDGPKMGRKQAKRGARPDAKRRPQPVLPYFGGRR